MTSSEELDTLFGLKNNEENQSLELKDAIDTRFKLIPRGSGPFREKYRPQKINEVAPTCSIELLRNQIDNPNASQIYLFEGESGTGKTSCARILAKAYICESSNTNDKPCLKCEACIGFDSSYDKIELNAANQNKIEDIRELVEDWRYGPAIYRKKIYILDEVQRLTAASQQILLTELEEPYPYLLVFLCTTDIKEINKALVDRACRITFGKLKPADARTIIQQVATYEKLTIADEIFESLYLHSKGSIRALLNNIQSYSQNGYNPQIWPEDEATAEINNFYKLISKGDWPSLAKLLSRPEVRKDPEAIRTGLENYMRVVLLKTSNVVEAQKLGNAMMRIQGSLLSLPSVTQYNELIIKILRACVIFSN